MYKPNMKSEIEFNLEDYQNRFGGVARLYGVSGLKSLLNSHILIVGLGGVGSWCAESLVRSGIGSITLVDLDDICITNTNRQLPAMNTNYGKQKVDVLKDRLLAINPQCQVRAINDFFTESTADSILDIKYDYAVDAIDSLANKALLVAKCKEKNIPIIVTGGAAGKIDPTQITIADLGLSENDSLLFRLRKKLRQKEVLPKIAKQPSDIKKRKKLNIPCVYSPEAPVYPTSDGGVCAVPESESNLKLDCESGMGSVTHITALFGLMCTSHVVNHLTGIDQLKK